MDITAFSSDIDELVEAFVEIDGLELSQMKELWRSRSFGFIHEARLPQVTIPFFMQALYSCALEFLKDNVPWSKQLGGLYVMYILYETQIPVPPIKIYLSTDNLENIYSLVLKAKANGPLTALRIVNRMMVRDSFLYGSVSVTGKKMKESFRELSSKATEHVRRARKRLFASSSATRHFEGNMIKDLGLDELALLNQEYEIVKQRVYKGAAETAEDDYDSLGPIFGDELKKDVNLWLEERKCFFGKQGQDITESQGQEKGSGMDAENEKGASSERQESGQCEEKGCGMDGCGDDYVFEVESQDQEKGSGMDGGADDEVFKVESQDQEKGYGMDGGGDDYVFEMEAQDQEKGSGMDGGADDEVFEVESQDQEEGLRMDGGSDDDVFKFELERALVSED